MPGIRFVKLPAAALVALVAGDLDTASQAAGTPLSRFLVDENWLWSIRLADITRDPKAADWIARAALSDPEGIVIGHGGFHGPPDEDGVVEVAYSVDPAHRRQGY